MIITCPSCKKKFEIDASLIPVEGRDLQCGSCQNIWFYKDEKEIPETLISKEITTEQELFSDEPDEHDELQIDKILKKTKNKNKSPKIRKKDSNFVSRFFSYLIILIISMVAIIILIDTLKKPLFDIFPGLEIILFNLYETLKDIKLFIIDLS